MNFVNRIITSILGIIIINIGVFLCIKKISLIKIIGISNFELGSLAFPIIITLIGLFTLFYGLLGNWGLRFIGSSFIGLAVFFFVLSTFVNHAATNVDILDNGIRNNMAVLMKDEISGFVIQEMQQKSSDDSQRFAFEKVRENCKYNVYQETNEEAREFNTMCEKVNTLPIEKTYTQDQFIEELVNEQVDDLVDSKMNNFTSSDNYNKMFTSIENTKRYTFVFKIIAFISFIIGFLFLFFGKAKDIIATLTGVSFDLFIGGIGAIVIYFGLNIFLKNQLASGAIMNNPLFANILPSEIVSSEAMREMSTKLIRLIGSVMYDWLKVAINKALTLSIIITVISLISVIVFFITKKVKGKKSNEK